MLLAGAVFLAGNLPLWHTDFWGHLRFGQVLLHNGFFTHEPISPYTDHNATYIHFQWLVQVSYALLFGWGETLAGGDAEQRLRGGVEAIRLLHALLCGLLFLFVYLAARAREASPGVAALALLVTLLFSLSTLLYHRPQLFGQVCFVAVLALVGRRAIGWSTVAIVVPLFVLWANLHGSFVAGLFVLGLLAAGRGLDLLTSPEGSFAALIRDAEFWRRCLLPVLATGAIAVLNPHGPALFGHVLAFGRHPNLTSLSEWLPIEFRWGGGGHVGWLLLAGLVVVTRLVARTSFTWGERLLLLAFFAVPFLQQRLQTWLVLLVPWVLARPWQHARDRLNEQGLLLPTGRFRAIPVVAAFLLLLALATQPAVRWLLRGSPPGSLEGAVSPRTPWEVGLHWQESPPPGPIFASETVGDFLFWALPEGSPVMMTTHAHLFPPEHWDACLKVKYLLPGWQDVLADHDVRVILVDAADHPGLVAAVSRLPQWRVVRDGQSPSRLFLAERR